MANCSIPNSTPATGRTSTTSSRRSRRLSSASSSFFEASRLAKAIGPWTLRFLNAQRSTFNAQHSIHTIERWALDTACPPWRGRWTFSSFWRVKGAWWPSRSSKPSSPCKRRGRFDSYPLRLDFSTLNAQLSTLNVQFRQLDVPCWTLSVGRFLLLNSKGGESDVA